MSNPFRTAAVRGIKPGDTFRFNRTFAREDTLAFGDMTRDYNPVHYDDRWTALKGFSGHICHGLLVGSMICEFGGQVGWLATGMEFKFIAPVYFGDTIECTITMNTVEASGRATASAVFSNQENRQVALAQMSGRIPLEKEKQLLKEMMNEGDPSNKLHQKRYL